MEPSTETFNLGLFIWQVLALIAVILVFFLLVKIYKKISKYLDLQIKYLEKRIESEDE